MRNLFKNRSWKQILWSTVGIIIVTALGGQYSNTISSDSGFEGVGDEVNLPDNGVARVKYVIDGDTIVLDNDIKIRMLGIDTPERGEPYYDTATERLKELVDKKEVTLKKDVSETDRYGRGLRHVYVGDTWINEIMIEEGLARMVTYPPDVAHKDHFRALQREALENNRGLWQNINN